MDTSDIDMLKDALGGTGVDLRVWYSYTSSSSYTTSNNYTSYEDRTRKQPPKPNFNTTYLSATIQGIISAHKLTSTEGTDTLGLDTVNYLALALRARLQDLIQAMIVAAKHRTETQFERPPSMYEDTPMWSIRVRSDVAKQLAVLERIEREEETKVRRERKERAEMAAAQAQALLQAQNGGVPGAPGSSTSGSGLGGAGGDDDEPSLTGGGGGTKKKRKKDGPGVTAKNMSADVQKKMSNAAASHAAGLAGRYAWMNAGATGGTGGSTGGTTTKKNANDTSSAEGGAGAGATTNTGATTSTTTGTPPTTTMTTTTSGWARPYVSSTYKKGSSDTNGTTTTTDGSGSGGGGGGSGGGGGGGAVGVGGGPGEEGKGDGKLSITMRDAMFVIEKERGHGAGRGAARGWC
ncbi:hypothetical protein EV360DRAFT_96151 [Lentinula raphanica]|nr:hypothetical protein EV360DRAFT_96151 [Lentinula raphanica]